MTHEFTLEDLADGAVRDKLRWAMSDPDRLRPGETRQGVTERAAATFAELAQSLRDRGHDPQTVAHFVNRLVFCLFAEDVGLLPTTCSRGCWSRRAAGPASSPSLPVTCSGPCPPAAVSGSSPWPGSTAGCSTTTTRCRWTREGIETVLRAAALDWSEIDPSIFGTLFERGLDPDKRSQLGAHYTDHDRIMAIVDPVIVRPLLAEWAVEKEKVAEAIAREDKAGPVWRRRRSGP